MQGKVILGSAIAVGLATVIGVSVNGSSKYKLYKDDKTPSVKFVSEPDLKETPKDEEAKFWHFNWLFLADASDNTNNEWWNWSYKNFSKDLRSKLIDTKKLKGVASTLPTSGSGLRTWCNNAYQLSPIFTDETKTPREGPLYDQAYVWKYCSPFEHIPTVIDNHSDDYPIYSESQIGFDSDLYLVSATDERNNKFWNAKSKHFYGQPYDSIEGEWFRYGYNKKWNLRYICAEVYKLERSDVHKEQAQKYCSFSNF